MSCLKTDRIFGPCASCGGPAAPCHLDERTLKLYCAACCKSCTAQVSIDWERPPAPTLRASQESLF